MNKIVFATNNAHKLQELREIVGEKFTILSLNDIDCHDDIPETCPTIEGNAEQKARFIKDNYGYDCFSDDTCLEIDALGGEPGVYSARYAGAGHDSEANMRKVLEKHGDSGFGYDPIFQPDEADGRTFAQMTADEKNAISHRGRAVKKLVEFLCK